MKINFPELKKFVFKDYIWKIGVLIGLFYKQTSV